MVVCKEDLYAFRALLVLEHNIKKQRCVWQASVPRFCSPGPWRQGGCKGRTRHNSFLSMKRIGYKCEGPPWSLLVGFPATPTPQLRVGVSVVQEGPKSVQPLEHYSFFSIEKRGSVACNNSGFWQPRRPACRGRPQGASSVRIAPSTRRAEWGTTLNADGGAENIMWYLGITRGDVSAYLHVRRCLICGRSNIPE